MLAEVKAALVEARARATNARAVALNPLTSTDSVHEARAEMERLAFEQERGTVQEAALVARVEALERAEQQEVWDNEQAAAKAERDAIAVELVERAHFADRGHAFRAIVGSHFA